MHDQEERSARWRPRSEARTWRRRHDWRDFCGPIDADYRATPLSIVAFLWHGGSRKCHVLVLDEADVEYRSSPNFIGDSRG